MRPARALPYAPVAIGRCAGGALVLTLGNAGVSTCVLQVRTRGARCPWTYTIEPGRQLVESYEVGHDDFDFSVHGPNGFLRRFKGRLALDETRAVPRVDALVDVATANIRLAVENPAAVAVFIDVRDVYSGVVRSHVIAATQRVEVVVDTRDTLRWYDLIVSVRDTPLRWRLSGHVENGADGFSDPAIGGEVALDDDF